MSSFTLYHNPKCSKSREALQILQQHAIQPLIIEYLKAPLNLQQIKELSVHFNLPDFIRTKEPIFKELKLSLENIDDVLGAVVNHPILMQRPILTHGKHAIIARSSEKILEFVKSS